MYVDEQQLQQQQVPQPQQQHNDLFPPQQPQYYLSQIEVGVEFASENNKQENLHGVEAVFYPNGDLDLSSVIVSLKKKGFNIAEQMIFFYSYGEAMYIYCGKDPVPRPLNIPASSYVRGDGQKYLQLRVKLPGAPMMTSSSSSLKQEFAISGRSSLENNNNNHFFGQQSESPSSHTHTTESMDSLAEKLEDVNFPSHTTCISRGSSMSSNSHSNHHHH